MRFKNLNSTTTFSCMVEEMQQDFPCLFFIAVVQSGEDSGKASNYSVRNAKQLHDGPQQRHEIFVTNVFGLDLNISTI